MADVTALGASAVFCRLHRIQVSAVEDSRVYIFGAKIDENKNVYVLISGCLLEHSKK
jgi:hypothetical protein